MQHKTVLVPRTMDKPGLSWSGGYYQICPSIEIAYNETRKSLRRYLINRLRNDRKHQWMIKYEKLRPSVMASVFMDCCEVLAHEGRVQVGRLRNMAAHRFILRSAAYGGALQRSLFGPLLHWMPFLFANQTAKADISPPLEICR